MLREKIKGYDNIRVIVTILVVVGHCCSLSFMYGGYNQEAINPYHDFDLFVPKIVWIPIRTIIGAYSHCISFQDFL